MSMITDGGAVGGGNWPEVERRVNDDTLAGPASRLLWFAGLYLAGVAVTVLAAGVLRAILL